MYQGCTKDFDPVQTDIQGGAPGVTCPPVCLLMPVLERKTLNFPGSDTVRTGKRSQCHHPPCCPPLGCACLLIGGENNSRTSLPTLSYNCQNPMMRDIKAGHAGRSSGKRGRPLTWQKVGKGREWFWPTVWDWAKRGSRLFEPFGALRMLNSAIYRMCVYRRHSSTAGISGESLLSTLVEQEDTSNKTVFRAVFRADTKPQSIHRPSIPDLSWHAGVASGMPSTSN